MAAPPPPMPSALEASSPDAGWTAAETREAITRAPPIELDALCPDGDIVVLAPHPDDESLGCGGLIAQACEAGRDVVIVVLTDGAGSHPGSRTYPPAKLAAVRRAEAEAAASLLGASPPIFMAAPDGGLEAERATVAAGLLAALQGRHVGAVLTPWRADSHPDHRATYALGRELAWINRAVLVEYPVWGLILPDEAEAGARLDCKCLDITRQLDRKIAAISAHRSQQGLVVRDDPRGFQLNDSDLGRHSQPREAFFVTYLSDNEDKPELIR